QLRCLIDELDGSVVASKVAKPAGEIPVMRLNELGKDEVELQYGQQHDHRTDQRIEEELDRRVETVLAAPDTDQKIHRHQHHFPEHIKEEEIERDEDSQHPSLKQEEEDVELFLALFDVVPGAECGY